MKKNSTKTVNDSAKRIIRFEVLNSQRTAAVIDFDKILKGIPIKGLSIVQSNDTQTGNSSIALLRIKVKGLIESEVLEICENTQTFKPLIFISGYQQDMTRVEIVPGSKTKIKDFKVMVAGWSVCYFTFFISSKR